MAQILNARELIQLAQSLTRMQASITDFELHHYGDLNASQKQRLESGLAETAAAAGRLYAYAVKLEFNDVEMQLKQLTRCTENLQKFLQTTQKIQLVLDIVSSVAGLAGSIISNDLDGIATGIDEITQMVANP